MKRRTTTSFVSIEVHVACNSLLWVKEQMPLGNFKIWEIMREIIKLLLFFPPFSLSLLKKRGK